MKVANFTVRIKVKKFTHETIQKIREALSKLENVVSVVYEEWLNEDHDK